MKTAVIIPARYKSTRFEGKPLADILGKPMIQHVYERAVSAYGNGSVFVATDDRRISDAVKGFGGTAVMTSENHPTGTDRISEAALKIDADIIINLQGDEPLIPPDVIKEVASPLLSDKNILIATLATPIKDEDSINNPNVVKVVTDKDDFALYFSRYPIPYKRGEADVTHYKHIGIYAYRKDFLLKFVAMPQTALERAESLEQLRALENGFKIKTVKTDYDTIGVDTPHDLEEVLKLLKFTNSSATKAQR